MSESKQYMIAPDDCYEPDWEGYEPDHEDLAYEHYKEEVFDSMRLEYGDIDHELRDYRKHTDRQLRELSKERKSLRRELWNEYHYDVTDDTCTVDLDGETLITFSRDGVGRNEVPRLPRPRTRKDKRRMKTERRRALRPLRQLGFLTKRGCSPRQVTGYEDKSFSGVVAAV
jgi:hypothetical protein